MLIQDIPDFYFSLYFLILVNTIILRINFLSYLTLQQRAGTFSATKVEQHFTFEQLKIFKLPHILQKTI